MPNDTRTGFHPNHTPTPLESETTSLVTRGGTTEAALMEVSVKIARQFPRDERKIVQKLRETLALYPQFAEKALYSIPYKDNRSGRQVKVEGLTIRAAETLASAWGNLRTGVRFLDEDDAGINLEAVVFDMEANLWELVPGRVLKMLKTREGRMVLLDERSLLQARGAAASKVKRNAILSILPLHVKAFFEAEVRKHMAGGELNQPAAPDRVTRALARFEKDYTVSQEQLEGYVGKPVTLWVGEDIADLQGLFNALEQGETTVAEAFSPEKAEPVTVAAPVPPVVVEAKDNQLQPSPRAPEPPPVAEKYRVETEPKPRADIVPMEPEPKPAPRPMPPPPPQPPKPKAANGRKRATPYTVPTAQVDMPEATPIRTETPSVSVPPVAEEELALRLRLSAEIAASPLEALDGILGRIYQDRTLPREVKRDALDWVEARRDALAQPQ